MNTLSLRITYRPLRIGWCVREGNFDELRKVLRLTHSLWGGRYNPIIPVGPDSNIGKQLIESFQVDALYPATDDPILKHFTEQFPHLPWPMLETDLVVDWGESRKIPTVLDIYHPIMRMQEERAKNTQSNSDEVFIYEWDASDSLSDLLLISCGAFPQQDEVGTDYPTLIRERLSAKTVTVKPTEPVRNDLYTTIRPSSITTAFLEVYNARHFVDFGIYFGDCSDFHDLVSFWNLRASALKVAFYDPTHAERLDSIRTDFISRFRALPKSSQSWRDRFAVWARDSASVDRSLLGQSTEFVLCSVSPEMWNRTSLSPHVQFESQSVLGAVDETGEATSVTFQLPPKPTHEDHGLHRQHLVASIHPWTYAAKRGEITFCPPFIPELNEYYGRNCHYIWHATRAEPDSLGIVVAATDDNLTLWALENRNLIARVFQQWGMKAEPSQPGLVATRLIQQMGGLQGCRVFKLAGVRQLIESHSPLQSFTRSEAVRTIGRVDPHTGQPSFSEYEGLYIEPRITRKLTPEAAFIYLMKKGVFRVGLKFTCPSCQLEPWISLDDTRTVAICEFCGNEFNVTPQLRDRDWAYRRSGLFGRDDHQEGAIPVVMTLQQLDTVLMRSMSYTTAMQIHPLGASVKPCETDLVVMTAYPDGKVQLVIGECKTRKLITQQDVENLQKVADALPSSRFETYLLFSKLDNFTDEEIKLCRATEHAYRTRVIMLSKRELEPYSPYDKTVEQFAISKTAVSLEDLAKNTHDVFFEPRRRTENGRNSSAVSG